LRLIIYGKPDYGTISSKCFKLTRMVSAHRNQNNKVTIDKRTLVYIVAIIGNDLIFQNKTI